MPNNRTNKTIAGYHLLMILAASDFRFKASEDMVIRDYLEQEFPFHVNLDREMEKISGLLPDEWETHFLKYMDDFYDDATPDERNNLLQFALDLSKADGVITKEENRYLQLLFENWHAE
ncbi:MAG: TerB family tellurite resistance protein [Edaphocola sp.]